MSIWSRLLGVDRILEDQRELMKEVLKVSQAQTEVAAELVRSLGQWLEAFQVTGPPTQRPPMDDALEAALYEAWNAEQEPHGPVES